MASYPEVKFPQGLHSGLGTIATGIAGAQSGLEHGYNLAELAKEKKRKAGLEERQTAAYEKEVSQKDPVALAGRNFHWGTSAQGSIKQRKKMLEPQVQAGNQEAMAQWDKLDQYDQQLTEGLGKSWTTLLQAGLDPMEPKNLDRFGITITDINPMATATVNAPGQEQSAPSNNTPTLSEAP